MNTSAQPTVFMNLFQSCSALVEKQDTNCRWGSWFAVVNKDQPIQPLFKTKINSCLNQNPASKCVCFFLQMEKSEIWVFFKPTNFSITNKAWSYCSIEQGGKESLKQTSFFLPSSKSCHLGKHNVDVKSCKCMFLKPESNGQRRAWRICTFCWLKRGTQKSPWLRLIFLHM